MAKFGCITGLLIGPNLVYGPGPTTPVLYTWKLFLSTRWLCAWKNAATHTAWLSAVPGVNQQRGLALRSAPYEKPRLARETALRYNGAVVGVHGISSARYTMHINSKIDRVGIKRNLLLLILVTIYWILALLGPWNLFGNAGEAVYYIQNLAWLAFVLVHGSQRYGWDNLFVFFTIAFLISWSSEAASIAIGFPFGDYHYTDLLGPKIGAVPMAVMPAYFVAGYLAWTMSTVFHANLGTGIERRNLFLVPFVASFVMVMWDFCLDPIRSTIDGAWVWEDGGAYHAVPVSNYFGWFLTSFVIFQVFALYINRFSKNERVGQSKLYWYLAPVMYLGLAVEFLLNPFFHSTSLDIYWSVFLGCIFTMVFTSILNLIYVSRLAQEGF